MTADIMNIHTAFGSEYNQSVSLYDINRAFENARYLKYYGPSTDKNNVETHTRVPRHLRRDTMATSMPIMEQDIGIELMPFYDDVNNKSLACVDWIAWFKRHSIKVYPANEQVSNYGCRSAEELAKIANFFCVESDKVARERKRSERNAAKVQRAHRGAKISPKVNSMIGEPLDISDDSLRRVVAMFCVQVEEPETKELLDMSVETCNKSHALPGLNASKTDQEVLSKKRQNFVLKFIRGLKETVLGH